MNHRNLLCTISLIVLALATALPAAADGGNEEVDPDHVVLVFNFGYRDEANDAPVTFAEVGDIVRFQWVSGSHTVTSGVASQHIPELGDLDSPPISFANQVYDVEVTEEGVFPFTCRPHATMNGLLVVEEAE